MSTPDDVRELALALPDTIERSSYGTPGFRVADRLFARLHQDGESLVVWVDMDEREMLAQTEPEKFFWTPHYEKHPMLQVRLAAVDRDGVGRTVAGLVATEGVRGGAEEVRKFGLDES